MRLPNKQFRSSTYFYILPIMRLSLFALLLTFAIGISSCQDEIEMPRPEMERLIGTWKLYSVFSSWGGQYNTDTSDYSMIVKFKKNGTLTKKVSDSRHIKLLYSIEIPDSYKNKNDRFIINYEETDTRNSAHRNWSDDAILISNDTLYLTLRNACDAGSLNFYRD